mgnify:CR=1 FL=1
MKENLTRVVEIINEHDACQSNLIAIMQDIQAEFGYLSEKTLAEAKAYMGEDAYAIGDLATAGCTIKVGEFMNALEKAVANAKDSAATAADSLNVALVSSNSLM